MDPTYFLRGLLIGFSIAAPVGPIGVLCIRRTLAEGRVYGFVSGLGAATADATYGSIAGFGLTFIASFLVSQGLWLRLIGGLFLVYLGLRTFLTKPAAPSADTGGGRLALTGAFASTFLLTLPTRPQFSLRNCVCRAGPGNRGRRLLRCNVARYRCLLSDLLPGGSFSAAGLACCEDGSTCVR